MSVKLKGLRRTEGLAMVVKGPPLHHCMPFVIPGVVGKIGHTGLAEIEHNSHARQVQVAVVTQGKLTRMSQSVEAC